MEQPSSPMVPFQRRLIYSLDAYQSDGSMSDLPKAAPVETGARECLHWLIARSNNGRQRLLLSFTGSRFPVRAWRWSSTTLPGRYHEPWGGTIYGD